ncbi:MAG: hypothetical protein V7724_16110 [Sediminicola sp.]|mgnify:CR=1 FL=1|tara:strand:+ start:46503 stop:48512 length:2010 start_codon:yes stop_codon:yes gene_type:complete
MKKNSFQLAKYGIMACLLVLIASCKDDDDNSMVDVPTCSDGIMNGDETGVDCGGSCDDCEPGMELGRRTELFVTNTVDGKIAKYSITGDSLVTFGTVSTSAEGIYYDKESDIVVQASRSGLQLEAYSGIGVLQTDTDLPVAFNSNADLTSPRALAVNGDTYVVADNDSHQFFVYTATGNGFTLTNTVDVPFPVWGITFKGKDLYAVVDISSDLAVFYDFSANLVNGTLMPSKRITVEGIVRTHGLAYSAADDLMVMTDIGDAANTSDDGGFHLISDFSEKFDALSDGETLTMDMQVRVAGPSTFMGNPIDVAYDSETDAVYIAEVGNGKVLGFTSIGSGGDLAPTFNKDLEAASSIHFSSDETDGDLGMESMGQRTELYATSTSNGNISVYDGMGSLVKTVVTGSTASEGIYYGAMEDIVIQASRSNFSLGYYTDFSTLSDGVTAALGFDSGADLASPREIAVLGNKVVVSDTDMHLFFVYTFNGSSFTLQNTFDPGFNVWGITFMGDDLLAVVDNDSDLAIFTDFLENTVDGSLTADKRITIEGIVRTHGIDYSEADDVLVMTDIGDAANTTDDGGFQITQGFRAKLDALSNGGTLALSEQTRVSGPATLMGNPIDVAYDHKTKTVFIAETGNGKILGFTDALSATGDVAPSINNDLTAASSVYLYNN